MGEMALLTAIVKWAMSNIVLSWFACLFIALVFLFFVFIFATIRGKIKLYTEVRNARNMACRYHTLDCIDSIP